MSKKTQTQVVIETLEKLGGIQTLGLITQEALKNPDFKFSGSSPQANIRRIVQVSKEIYKIKPGLYSLEKFRKQNEEKGAIVETEKNQGSKEIEEFTHGYYQGLLITIGNLRNLKTYSPNQDNTRTFLDKKLSEIRTLQEIPKFSYDEFVKRSKTVDTIWFHETKDNLMPQSYFEVEHSTDIQNSLLKYADLRDFSAKKFIVADRKRKQEFEQKMKYLAFEKLKDQILFLPYDELVKQYEFLLESTNFETII
jgi:hypothetical protein